MNRRDALSRVALILGGTVIGANVFLKDASLLIKKYDRAGFSTG